MHRKEDTGSDDTLNFFRFEGKDHLVLSAGNELERREPAELVESLKAVIATSSGQGNSLAEQPHYLQPTWYHSDEMYTYV